ncbi:MAG: hypothetical protein IJV07_00250 [Alphaproteobacteria bacterium]|nr:hypothetical protein [Alphaproteobacteria bacterium]
MRQAIPDLFKKTVPFIGCLLLILLSQNLNARFVFVPMVFIPIFYFAVFRPRCLNAYAIFSLGVFADLINQTPFGLFSFVFVLLFFVTRLNHLFLKTLSFRGLWTLFSVFSGLLLLIQLFIFTLCEGAVVHTRFLFEQFSVLVLLYPLGMTVCNIVNNWIGEDE